MRTRQSGCPSPGACLPGSVRSRRDAAKRPGRQAAWTGPRMRVRRVRAHAKGQKCEKRARAPRSAQGPAAAEAAAESIALGPESIPLGALVGCDGRVEPVALQGRAPRPNKPPEEACTLPGAARTAAAAHGGCFAGCLGSAGGFICILRRPGAVLAGPARRPRRAQYGRRRVAHVLLLGRRAGWAGRVPCGHTPPSQAGPRRPDRLGLGPDRPYARGRKGRKTAGGRQRAGGERERERMGEDERESARGRMREGRKLAGGGPTR